MRIGIAYTKINTRALSSVFILLRIGTNVGLLMFWWTENKLPGRITKVY